MVMEDPPAALLEPFKYGEFIRYITHNVLGNTEIVLYIYVCMLYIYC